MGHRATYSPEDNKLRLYPNGVRIDDELGEEGYKAFKSAGFRWAAKQECFVCPSWSTTAEDMLLSMCDEIEDEDYSPEERSADRAERFSGYRDNRLAEAGGLADRFDAGPSAFGHQNRQRAERQAQRHDRLRVNAVSQWDKAEYWQTRTAGVIAHALYRSSAPVRRSRILRLEAEQRKHLAGIDEAAKKYNGWKSLLTMEGADVLINEDREDMNPAQRLAYSFANYHSHWEAMHPTCEEVNAKARELGSWQRGFSACDFLTKTEFLGVPFPKLTPRQVAEWYVKTVKDPTAEDCRHHRWSRHYEFRLTYERAMLAAEGGTAAEADMEPGGWIRGVGVRTIREDLPRDGQTWRQIQAVVKSPVTGRVTSVKVMGLVGYREQKPGLVLCNVERLPEGAYRAPTDEERAAFAAAKKAAKAGKKPVPTINPTAADADRLQRHWNATAAAVCRKEARTPSAGRKVEEMTQAQFSDRLKYGYVHIREIKAGEVVFKIRTYRRGFYDYHAADSVIVLTDKPKKPIPAGYWSAVVEAIPGATQSATDGQVNAATVAATV